MSRSVVGSHSLDFHKSCLVQPVSWGLLCVGVWCGAVFLFSNGSSFQNHTSLWEHKDRVATEAVQNTEIEYPACSWDIINM